MRPPCKKPPGVIGSFGWDEFNFPVDGVSRSDDGDWAAIVLEKKAKAVPLSPWGVSEDYHTSECFPLTVHMSSCAVMPSPWLLSRNSCLHSPETF